MSLRDWYDYSAAAGCHIGNDSRPAHMPKYIGVNAYLNLSWPGPVDLMDPAAVERALNPPPLKEPRNKYRTVNYDYYGDQVLKSFSAREAAFAYARKHGTGVEKWEGSRTGWVGCSVQCHGGIDPLIGGSP